MNQEIERVAVECVFHSPVLPHLRNILKKNNFHGHIVPKSFAITVFFDLSLHTFNLCLSDEIFEPFLQSKAEGTHSLFLRDTKMFQRQFIYMSGVMFRERNAASRSHVTSYSSTALW